MQHRMKLNTRWRRYALIGISILLVAAMFYTGFAWDMGLAILHRMPLFGSYGPPAQYLGPSSLEERIIEADVIARVELKSVSQTVESNAFQSETLYSRALKFDFKVLEYLKGSGASDIVAVAFDTDEMYKSRPGAMLFSDREFLDDRDTQWDDKEAVVFLTSNTPSLPSSSGNDRYAIGILRFSGSDYFTIDSRYSKRWLPEDSSANTSGSVGQRFLTGGVPVNIEVVGASGASGISPSMTLATLKARIADIEGEVDAGDGSKEYKECVHAKYVWAREMRWRQDYKMSVRPDLGRQSIENHDFNSGVSRGSDAFIEANAKFRVYDQVLDGREYWLTGTDKDLFNYVHPGIGKSVRPLPEGNYEVYAHERLKELVLCNGYPEVMKTFKRIFVTVTAPAGTLHEAFFDPVAIGAGFGADATNGVLKLASFTPTSGSATTISGINWEAEKVKIRLSPHTTLTDKHIDFLALDASVALRLDFDDATVVTEQDNTKSLTWGVCKQPWKAGDLLMLRISASPQNLTGVTNDASCGAPTPPKTE